MVRAWPRSRHLATYSNGDALHFERLHTFGNILAYIINHGQYKLQLQHATLAGNRPVSASQLLRVGAIASYLCSNLRATDIRYTRSCNSIGLASSACAYVYARGVGTSFHHLCGSRRIHSSDESTERDWVILKIDVL